MSEQYLNHPYIHFGFQQVCGETMAQGMHRYPFRNPGIHRCCMAGTAELASTHVIDGVLSWKQPATLEHESLLIGKAPPGTQVFKQHR